MHRLANVVTPGDVAKHYRENKTFKHIPQHEFGNSEKHKIAMSRGHATVLVNFTARRSPCGYCHVVLTVGGHNQQINKCTGIFPRTLFHELEHTLGSEVV